MSDSSERFEVKTKSGYPPKFEEFCRTDGIPLDGFSIRRMAVWSAWQAAERDALERAAKVCDEWRRKNTLELCCDQAQHVALNAVAIAILALAGKE